MTHVDDSCFGPLTDRMAPWHAPDSANDHRLIIKENKEIEDRVSDTIEHDATINPIEDDHESTQ